ncbi:MAG: BON domain-containing protein [Rhodocyclaceae bacterium]|jgi:osmotically-inducible protein OsmY|nr:BON domain-containing protein [Rhodocyclaceae bacterium]MCE2980231.1 BON domain-containing protein [Betaproteobacteria bacterium]MCA3075440.1 BON domain-containing protein [Rhodocyclaceae bacterium]MCA3091925.1 BON domain-containing protein [Rhodocyclaceae bacterium]MCA3093181.1 BON domain-containing protein [Rhodocyclaceae bacterium]
MNRRLAALTIALTGLAAGGCVPLMVGGVATGILVADDRRSSGTVVDDQNIELRLANEISTQFGKVSNANVTSYNRVVLITGEATTEQVRAGIDKVVRAQAGVRHVQNELQIAGPSSLTARSNDSFITGRVKARIVDNQARGKDPRVQANHVKVVTEAGVVYLMGLLTAAEADQAAEIARTTSGVARVVRVFELIKRAPVEPAAAPPK